MPVDKQNSIDISFSVPFVHRLRVTENVAGDDFSQLLGVIHCGDAGPAKVLVIAEAAVHEASDRVSELDRKLSDADKVRRVGELMLVDGGEAIKNDTVGVQQVLAAINQHDLDRRSYIIAIGGGAMLDAVGYAAATAHRGIRLIRLPTTTLAQADSGVGVKNAINYFGKKNWVGTFAVPWAVINDTELLQTVSDRDFRSGFSEAVKVMLLKDREQFDWLCQHAGEICQRQMGPAAHAIHQSCMLHLRHITEGGDPFEMLEARPLDFGHWSAHRLEPLTDYQIRHGEAVGMGVAIDCLYSTLRYGFPESDSMRVCECLAGLGLPLWHPALDDYKVLMTGLEEFRQHLGGRLTITMLQQIGRPIHVHEIDHRAMADAVAQLKQVAKHMDGPICRSVASGGR
ncbi:3-dehydroquinate synthase [Stieleria varia]|uniref:3-dehydroquinate synthase n=1 Tax=Stieleria varia TaxID=2528005 RepID=A0A5C6B990_9BACT|nr:3-dehydroquinate synthase [Stieleria varia]TWU08530.1 3-dehydroquinate synthase [Stieleria varia]